MSDLSDSDSKSERQRHTSGGRHRQNSTGPGSRRQRLMSSGSDAVPMDTTNHTDNGATGSSVVAMQQGNSTVVTMPTNITSQLIRIKQEEVEAAAVKREPVKRIRTEEGFNNFCIREAIHAICALNV